MNTFNKIDGAFLVIGSAYGLSNLQTILGIVVLSLQVIWILTKLIVKIVHHIKTGKDLSELDDEVDDVIELISQAKGEGEDNGNIDRK